MYGIIMEKFRLNLFNNSLKLLNYYNAISQLDIYFKI